MKPKFTLDRIITITWDGGSAQAIIPSGSTEEEIEAIIRGATSGELGINSDPDWAKRREKKRVMMQAWKTTPQYMMSAEEIRDDMNAEIDSAKGLADIKAIIKKYLPFLVSSVSARMELDEGWEIGKPPGPVTTRTIK